MNISGLGFRGNCEDEKNREKILSLDLFAIGIPMGVTFGLSQK